jgi:hypothetical protein
MHDKELVYLILLACVFYVLIFWDVALTKLTQIFDEGDSL